MARPSTCAALAFCALGACLRVDEPSHWAIDRGVEAVLALDPEQCVLARHPVRSPRMLTVARGALWVASASSRSARIPDQLRALVPPAGFGAASSFEGILGLCADETGAALVLESAGPGETRLWRVGLELRRTLLGSIPWARALAAQAGEVLVGCADGALWRLRSDGTVVECTTGSGPVLELARGPRSGEWWMLSGSVEACVTLLGRGLVPSWSAGTGLAARRLAAVEGEPRAWVAAGSRARRYGPGGALEVELELAGGPWEAAWASDDRGVLLLAPGALLEVGERGGRARALRAQGGFGRLVAVAGER
jgi:hypothetical protein